MICRVAACVGLCCAAPAVLACDIALMLAVDVSGSVDALEYETQMTGLALALNDPSVAEAIVKAEAQIGLMQWSGTSRQVVSIPWRAVESYDALTAFALEVESVPRRWRNFSTAIGEAVALAIASFEDPRVASCKRHVIDVSGDGPSNEGTPPELARANAALRDITINAIAIEQSEENLTTYYRTHVITGPGAFAVRAATFADYPDRMRQKLLREVVIQLAVNE